MNKSEQIALFLTSEDKPRYLFGTDVYSKTALEFLQKHNIIVKGFIDEITDKKVFCDLPIIHNLNEVEKDAIILNCVVDAYPIQIKEKLDLHHLNNVDIFSLIKYSDIELDVSFWEGFNKSYGDHPDWYEMIYSKLSDEESKKTFDDIIKFRMTYDLSVMEGYKIKVKEQYFEPFLNLKDNESFLDAGGFDGMTSLEFIKHCPKYSRIYYFEPGPEQMEISKKNLSKYSNIEYFEFATYNKETTLHFSAEGTESKVVNDGGIEIKCNAIDNCVTQDISFIKMDIEGSEGAAIDGAKNTILKYHPKMAICVYHKGGDIVDIPRQVLSIREDYNLYLRHYTSGVDETVMYFVPF